MKRNYANMLLKKPKLIGTLCLSHIIDTTDEMQSLQQLSLQNKIVTDQNGINPIPCKRLVKESPKIEL